MDSSVPNTDQPLLQVQGLSVDLSVPAGALHAVQAIDFSVKAGETFCIVGESGCGKTMTSLALMRLLPRNASLTAQKLTFEGRDLLSLSDNQMAELRGDRLGMIFQDPMTSLNPVYTIGNQMEEVYLRHRKASRKEARERAEYMLQRVGIMSPALRLQQFPHQLSGGLRQRVMIAMTLMCEPKLIIADEPTTALDVTVQVQILQLLQRLQQEFGMAIILITHNLGIVARMADRLAVMYAGKIVETGTGTDVFRHPHHPYTQGLLRCMPTHASHTGERRLGSIPGLVPSLIGEIKGCSFRNRCDQAHSACAQADLTLREASPGHFYRCLLDAEASRAKIAEPALS
ncbi:MAG: ABC transporter ATP-binding protein [Alphaproteobacteria bacterium]|nr:ABC transporter ATP-binding protein [Alphaproteobacteria bacterium]